MTEYTYSLVPQNASPSAKLIKLIRDVSGESISEIKQELLASESIMDADMNDDASCVKMSLLYKKLRKLGCECKIYFMGREETIEGLDAGINLSKEISVEVGSDLFEKDEWWWNVDLDDVE